MREISAGLTTAFRESQIGSVHRALTLEDGSLVVTGNYLKVRIPPGRARNQWIDVRITGADPLRGEIMSANPQILKFIASEAVPAEKSVFVASVDVSVIIFDVQTNDPGVERKLSDDVTRGALITFANIYSGWEVVQNAAIVLEEAPDLILKPGRLCSNGKPVPLERADFRKYAQGLREAARVVLKAAQEKNQEKVSDATSDLIQACLNCHIVYRNTPPGGPFRCESHLDPNGR